MDSFSKSQNARGQVDARCHILNFPHELLYDILSLVLPFPIQSPKAVHAVRSVCKIFWLIANQLPFWREDEFWLNDFAVTSKYPGSSFVEVWLQDTHLVECLGEKKSWRIYIQDFDVIFRKVPRIANITERLILHHNVVQPNRETPTVLECFKNLQYLEIRIYAPIGISRLPPSVRTLVILVNNVCTYPPQPVLRRLGHVQHLREYSFFNKSSLSCDLINFLPLGSSSTLSTLTFAQPRSRDVEPDFVLFDTFVSLESLNLIDCSNGFFVYLQQSRLQLESLSLTWGNESQRIDEVMIATALRVSSAVQKLKHLSFSIPSKVYTRYGDLLKLWESLILAITRLPYLEDLKLGLPIYTEWCRHFENCSGIQTILWTIQGSILAGDVHALTKALHHLDPEPSVSFAFDYPWARELNDRDSDEEGEWEEDEWDEEGEDEDEFDYWPGEWWGEDDDEEEEDDDE